MNRKECPLATWRRTFALYVAMRYMRMSTKTIRSNRAIGCLVSMYFMSIAYAAGASLARNKLVRTARRRLTCSDCLRIRKTAAFIYLQRMSKFYFVRYFFSDGRNHMCCTGNYSTGFGIWSLGSHSF